MRQNFNSFHLRQAALGAGFALTLVFGSATTACADTPPRIDHAYPAFQPAYPQSAELAGAQGDVLVDVLVGANGKARKIRVNRSSGYADLDNAAVEAVANWHYIPAVRNGDTVTDWMTVKIHFAMPQPAAVPVNAAAPGQN